VLDEGATARVRLRWAVAGEALAHSSSPMSWRHKHPPVGVAARSSSPVAHRFLPFFSAAPSSMKNYGAQLLLWWRRTLDVYHHHVPMASCGLGWFI
jgi:hypothetical protein